MKKNKVVIIASVILGIAIVVFSVFWPPVPESQVAGTFKKADKYRENSVKEGDVVLNSELLADTTKTKKAIADLVQFGDFTMYVKSIINEWWIPVLDKYNSSPDINAAIAELKDFNSFIDNNNQTIQNTIVTLAGFYADSKQDVTADVESQIKQFYSYANQFLLRDSIFESTISKIDATIKNDNTRKDKIAALKNLRDRIVVDNFMYAVSVNDSAKIKYTSNQVLNNPKAALKWVSDENIAENKIKNKSKDSEVQGKNEFAGQIESQIQNSGNANKVTAVNAIENSVNQYKLRNFSGNKWYFGISPSKMVSLFNMDKIDAALEGGIASMQYSLFLNYSLFSFTNNIDNQIGNLESASLDVMLFDFSLGIVASNLEGAAIGMVQVAI